MTPTPTPTGVYTPTAEEIYDMIMGAIEPELMSDMLPLLDFVHADETPEEREGRLAGYEIAFKTYDERYEKFVSGWKNHYLNLRKEAEKMTRTTEEANEKPDIDSLEQSITQS